MPTILDILNISTDIKMEGVSFFSLISGKQKEHLKSYVFSFTPHYNQSSIRTNEYKLIYIGDEDKYELYNLKNDPEELNNLVDIEKEKFEFLKVRLNKWRKYALPGQEEKDKILDEETRKKLRSLGYVQ
jgi:arylsulfatase A-like enzyme